MSKKITIIVAAAANNTIRKDNALLWHLPEDLKRFKALTSGHAIIMGRKTFESLPKALPNRTNIVITRNTDYTAEAAVVCSSLEAALKIAATDPNPLLSGVEKFTIKLFLFRINWSLRVYIKIIREIHFSLTLILSSGS